MFNYHTIPLALSSAVLQDAVQRDPVTARRLALLCILWQERHLTRGQLIARVEMQLGKGCFGASAWDDIFYRDMRFVRSVFAQAGYNLRYSRKKGDEGYYLSGEPRLHEDEHQAIQGAIAELDDQQMAIYRRLSPAQKFAQAASIIDLGRKVAKGARAS